MISKYNKQYKNINISKKRQKMLLIITRRYSLHLFFFDIIYLELISLFFSLFSFSSISIKTTPLILICGAFK